MSSYSQTQPTTEAKYERTRERAERILYGVRTAMRSDPTTLIETFSVLVIAAWAGCLAWGGVFDATGSSLSMMRVFSELHWALIAGAVALLPLVLLWFGLDRYRHWGALGCAVFFGALCGLIGSQTLALPGFWVYALLSLLSLLPFWRRYL